MFRYNAFESSNIKEFTYTDNTEFVDEPNEEGFGVLAVTFQTGSVYEYYNVPESIMDKMVQSESKGAFLNKEIKDNYEYAKI